MSLQTASAIMHTAKSVPPHLVLGLIFPNGPSTLQTLPQAVAESYDLHRKLYARPGFAEVMRRVEREDYLTLPAMAMSIPSDLARIRRKFRDGDVKIPVQPPDDFPYPSYYLNDFHNQKNGNLSLQSALTYEWQISILFFNTNRLMRQGVIDNIPAGQGLEVLDLACGTGAYIPQAVLQGRKHHYTGIDLSSSYLRVAHFAKKLGLRPNSDFFQMNAESLRPEWSERFDIVTNIWLLHELPRAAIDRTLDEVVRVLKPGGKFLLMDSWQAADVPAEKKGLSDMVSRFFARYFNEPYYLAYQRLDIPALLQSHGLQVEKSETWFRSKLWVATKK